MGLKYKEKQRVGRKRFLVSFSQSKFSHFSNKKLMSCWNNTLLSAGIGWNFRSVSLLLGHIQPVAIENTACKAALCCEEIALLVAVGFLDSPLLPLSIKSSSQTPTNHCFITHCGSPAWRWFNMSRCLLLPGQSEKDRGVQSLSSIVHMGAKVWWALPKHLVSRGGGERERRRG